MLHGERVGRHARGIADSLDMLKEENLFLATKLEEEVYFIIMYILTCVDAFICVCH